MVEVDYAANSSKGECTRCVQAADETNLYTGQFFRYKVGPGWLAGVAGWGECPPPVKVILGPTTLDSLKPPLKHNSPPPHRLVSNRISVNLVVQLDFA